MMRHDMGWGPFPIVERAGGLRNHESPQYMPNPHVPGFGDPYLNGSSHLSSHHIPPSQVARRPRSSPGRSRGAAGGPKSEVLKNADVTLWYNQAYLIPHEGIREWMDDLDRVLVNNPGFDAARFPWKVSNFFLFYKNYFYLFVQAHHDTEEKLITPWFEGKGMHFPEKVSEDHHYLIAALNKIVSMEGVYRGIVREGGSERGPKLASWTADLKDQMKGLNNNMRKHLCEEESMYPTAMRDQASEREWRAMEHRIMQRGSLKEHRNVLPHLLECMAKEEVAKLEAKIPWPVRYQLNRSWRPAYRKYTKELVRSMELDTDPQLLPPTGCCGFVS